MQQNNLFMESWSVSRRIFTGFAITLLLMCVVAIVSSFATWNLSSVFTDYRGKARQSLVVYDIVDDLYDTRLAALKYRLGSSDDAATEVREKVQSIIDHEKLVNELFETDQEWASIMSKLSTDAINYADAFKEMTALQSQRETLVAVQIKTGPKARKQLTSIMESAYQDSDSDAAYYAGIAQEELMLGRFYAERYLLTNIDTDYSAALTHFEVATQRLSTLLTTLDNPTRREDTISTIEDIALYKKTFDQLHDVLTSRNLIRTGKLDVLGPQMQKQYHHVLEKIAEQQNIIGPYGTRQATYMLILVVIMAITSFIIGSVLALKISGSVAGSIKGMASNMDDLAKGKLNIEIKGAEQPHELGLMAKALMVFRTNGLNIRRLAEEKSEADTIAAQERVEESKRMGMMDTLQTELRTVVDLAVAGDFTGRVPANFSDQMLNDLAKRVNLLLETTEKGLNETVSMLGSMSKGDLTARIDSDYQGTFNQLKQDANQTSEQFTSIITNIRSAANTVDSASKEINTGNIDLSQRTERAAASLQETASSMVEMTASVKDNAANAKKASNLALATKEKAEEGGKVVSGAVKAMNDISESSDKISSIIGVIDDIAFQTNLLALNASVEAARAGEQGRGFAVVASEVRNLAGRSATAAKEIKDLIDDSVNRVENGKQLVNKSGKSLDQIVAEINKVTDIVSKISASVQGQAEGITMVNQAISQLDEATQQNAALVEQASAASSSTIDQVDGMIKLIGFFSTGEPVSQASTITRSNTALPALPKKTHNPEFIRHSVNAAHYTKPALVANSDANSNWEEF